MLCSLCHSFIGDLLARDLSNWTQESHSTNDDQLVGLRHIYSRSSPRAKAQWYSFRHHDTTGLESSAEANCDACMVMAQAIARLIPGHAALNEKWKMRNNMVRILAIGQEHEYMVQLQVPSPIRTTLKFELFNPYNTVVQSLAKETESSCESRGNGFAYPRSYPLPEDAGSSSRFELIRIWIETCQDSHDICQRNSTTPLPARVVDVGASDGSEDPKLYISHGQSRPYLTLSYCWGQGSRSITTHKTLEKYQRAIPMASLPATIQDAITITRKLGQRYIWIDCLCIVQDSYQDWNIEAAKMCEIYQNSLVCLSALAADDSDSGMLKPKKEETVTVVYNEQDNSKVGFRTAPLDHRDAIETSPLSKRAWCYQEHILAPAVVQFTASQIFWECKFGSATESQPSLEPKTQLDSSNMTAGSHMESDWNRTVEAYSGRCLTYQTDRLRAIQGLARKFQSTHQPPWTYLSGLWLEDVHRGLMWRSASKDNRRHLPPLRTGKTPAGSGIAKADGMVKAPTAALPSWSWASTIGGVLYSSGAGPVATAKGIPLSPSDATFSAPFPRSSDRRSPWEQVAVLNATGYLKSGTYKTTATKPRESPQDFDGLFRPRGSASDPTSALACELDDLSITVNNCYCLRVADFYSPNHVESHMQNLPTKGRKKAKNPDKCFYLILERCAGSVTGGDHVAPNAAYKRVGMGYDDMDKVNRVFANTHKQDIALY